MVKKLIIFQFHDKKLLLPFGMALAQIILNIINSTGMESSKNQILELVMTTFSRLSLIFVPTSKEISEAVLISKVTPLLLKAIESI